MERNGKQSVSPFSPPYDFSDSDEDIQFDLQFDEHAFNQITTDSEKLELELKPQGPNEESTFESIINSIGLEWKQSTPSVYRFVGTDLNFNFDCNEPMSVIEKPMPLLAPLTIPKLQRACPNNKLKDTEMLADPESPVKNIDIMQENNPKPVPPIKDNELDSIPTSEDIWTNYEAMKKGAEPVWPLCCAQTAPSLGEQTSLDPKEKLTLEKTSKSHDEQLQEAIDSIINDDLKGLGEKNDTQASTMNNIAYMNMELDSLELSLDEERVLVDFLKSEQLHTPLADIKVYEMCQAMTRDEESRKSLHGLLKTNLMDQLQLKPKETKELMTKECQQDTLDKEIMIVKEATVQEQTIEELPEETTEATIVSEVASLNIVSNEILKEETEIPIERTEEEQLELDIEELINMDEETQPETEKQILIKSEKDNHHNDNKLAILNVEVLPSRDPAPNTQDEVAIQQWLTQLSQDLSRVVQSRIESMPEPVSVTEQPISASTSLTNESIDFETQISQTKHLPENVNLSTTDSNKSALSIDEQVPSTSQWQSSYKTRLKTFEKVIDKNMTEFREPQAKRLRSRWGNDTGLKNLESHKRTLLMPALPSNIDQGLQQIRILRPPTQRKTERAKLPIDMKIVRTYSAMQANSSLDLHQLALEMENAVYNSDIQVLQVRYEGAQVAWVWDNGSILITNARSKVMIVETQKNLISKIQDVMELPDLATGDSLSTHMISIAHFPWHIYIEEFSQTYALSTETVQGSFRYAYYVNKSLPSVSAKVYESGIIHVFAVNTDQADRMLEKLYLLTANHRKPKTTTIQTRANRQITP